MIMTDTSREGVIAAGISTIGAMASGIKKSFYPVPASIDTAFLPALYSFTGPAQYDDQILGNNLILVARIFRVQVPVLPTGQGDPNSRETKIPPMIEAVKDVYFSYPKLGDIVFVQNSIPRSDSGIVILPEWGGKYIGFEIRLEVQYIRPIVFRE